MAAQAMVLLSVGYFSPGWAKNILHKKEKYQLNERLKKEKA
jgi:hypothetical protein